MAKVSVLNIAVLENLSLFHSPFWFEISFECNEALEDDLEWEISYTGSAESEFDQIRDSVLVDPVPAGRHMFIFQADAPNPSLIPETDALGVTMAFITCSYHRQEFIRVGYNINSGYLSRELCQEPAPEATLLSAPVEHLGLKSPGELLPHRLEQQHGQVGGHREPGSCPGLRSPLRLHQYQGLGFPGCIMGLLPENSRGCI